MVASYFRSLYNSRLNYPELVTNELEKRLSNADRVYLSADFTPQEVKEAVFAIHPDKALGMDSLNAGFFQHYWDIIG